MLHHYSSRRRNHHHLFVHLLSAFLPPLTSNTDVNLLQPLAARQELLQNIWGFTCTCSLCSSQTKNHASEANVQMIIKYQTAVSDWSSDSVATPAMALRLVELYEEEELWAGVGTAHLFAALAYNAVGKVER